MNEKRLLLAVRRGQLTARIAAQRSALAEQSQALKTVCSTGDAVLHGIDWLKRHPLEIGAAVAVAVIASPRRIWRWGRRGFFVWRGWQAVRRRLLDRA